MPELILKSEAYHIIGSAMQVHKTLGPGFLEAVYQEALSIEFTDKNIPYIQEAPLTITYKGKPLQKEYLADFICYHKIILELKATSSLEPIHEAQVINYLKATGYQLGLLINFGESTLTYKRIVNERY